jgi:hypothetical protein
VSSSSQQTDPASDRRREKKKQKKRRRRRRRKQRELKQYSNPIAGQVAGSWQFQHGGAQKVSNESCALQSWDSGWFYGENRQSKGITTNALQMMIMIFYLTVIMMIKNFLCSGR